MNDIQHFCLSGLSVGIRTRRMCSNFYFLSKTDDNKMNHCNHRECVSLFLHGVRTVCIHDSVCCLMYLMKESSKILFQFFIQAMTEEKRKSITLFEDQYRFFKTFNSPNLLIAFVEFMFEDKLPQNLNEQEQVIFDSLIVRMNNLKKKSIAWAKWWKNSHWWWRSKNTEETTEKQTKNKQKTSKKQAELKAENKQEQVQVQDKVQEKENTEIILSNDSESADSVVYWNTDVNECLNLIKQYNWWLIDWTVKNNRRYAKLLIDKLNKLDSIKNWRFTRNATLELILQVISKNKYHASKITSPESIFRNLAILMQTCKNDVWKAHTNQIVLPTI